MGALHPSRGSRRKRHFHHRRCKERPAGASARRRAEFRSDSDAKAPSNACPALYPPGSVEWLSPDEFLSVACCAGFDSTDVTWMDAFEAICLEYGCDPAVGV